MSHEKALEEAELLPCPFCGGKARIVYAGATTSRFSIEHDCETVLPVYPSKADAIAAWNRRAPLSALVHDEVAGVVERLNTFVAFVRNAPVSSGVCCCGEDMANHAAPMSCGHSPVDQWDYSLSGHLRSIASIPSTLTALAARAEKAERDAEEALVQSERFCDKYLAALTRVEAAEAELSALRARLEEAGKVIEPFAEVAKHDIGESETDDDRFRPMGVARARAPLIRVGHLRAARRWEDEAK